MSRFEDALLLSDRAPILSPLLRSTDGRALRATVPTEDALGRAVTSFPGFLDITVHLAVFRSHFSGIRDGVDVVAPPPAAGQTTLTVSVTVLLLHDLLDLIICPPFFYLLFSRLLVSRQVPIDSTVDNFIGLVWALVPALRQQKFLLLKPMDASALPPSPKTDQRRKSPPPLPRVYRPASDPVASPSTSPSLSLSASTLDASIRGFDRSRLVAAPVQPAPPPRDTSLPRPTWQLPVSDDDSDDDWDDDGPPRRGTSTAAIATVTTSVAPPPYPSLPSPFAVGNGPSLAADPRSTGPPVGVRAAPSMAAPVATSPGTLTDPPGLPISASLGVLNPVLPAAATPPRATPHLLPGALLESIQTDHLATATLRKVTICVSRDLQLWYNLAAHQVEGPAGTKLELHRTLRSYAIGTLEFDPG